MAEMVVPDSVKQTCKIIKWVGGAPIWVVSEGIDKITAGVETQLFGKPIPADIQTFTGTLPSAADLEVMSKIATQLPAKVRQKGYGHLEDLAKISLKDVLNEAAQEEALRNIQEGVLDQTAEAIKDAFTPTP